MARLIWDPKVTWLLKHHMPQTEASYVSAVNQELMACPLASCSQVLAKVLSELSDQVKQDGPAIRSECFDSPAFQYLMDYRMN